MKSFYTSISASIIILLGTFSSNFVKADDFAILGKSKHFGNESTIQIFRVEQIGSSLLIVSTEEIDEDTIFDNPTHEKLSESLWIDAPSLAISGVLDIRLDSRMDRQGGPLIYYRNPEYLSPPSSINSYSINLNEPWVNSLGIGMIKIDKLPWIYHENYGWFWTSDSFIWNGLPAYWFYSSELGWLVVNRVSFPTVWSQESGDWITLIESKK